MRRKRLAVALVALGLVIGASPAAAVVVTDTAAVSCSSGTWKSLGSVWTGGDYMMFKQLSASPAGNTRVKIVRSPDGTVFDDHVYSTGVPRSWSSFAAGTYLFNATRSTSTNCNGILPGNGNYTLDYLVQY